MREISVIIIPSWIAGNFEFSAAEFAEIEIFSGEQPLFQANRSPGGRIKRRAGFADLAIHLDVNG